MKPHNIKFLSFIFLILILITSGCINNKNSESNKDTYNEKIYFGATTSIDYGSVNISSYYINLVLENYNIITTPDGNYVGLFFNEYLKYYDYPHKGDGLKSNYRGHVNDSIQDNLEFKITFWNDTEIKESDPNLDISYENDKTLIENIVNDITEIMEIEFDIVPKEIVYQKIMDYPDES